MKTITISRKKLYFLYIFQSLTLLILLYVCFRNWYINIQISEVGDTCNVCSWMINDANTHDVPDLISKMVYVYGYYPAGSKFVPKSSPLAQIVEQNREATLLLLLQNLKNKTGEDFGDDFDLWIEHYADERTRYSYESMKEYRESQDMKPFTFLVNTSTFLRNKDAEANEQQNP